MVERFNATFDRAEGSDLVPPLMHFCLANPTVASAGLGRDGHPTDGGASMTPSLPRRMWASGKVVFHAPIRSGERVSRHSTIAKVEEKDGKSGRLRFVHVDHVLKSADRVAVVERQVIVYRGELPDTPAQVGKPAIAAPTGEDVRRITASQALLFRYSALTFNTHRIHYDERYAREVENYPGLVVHGPLQATLLAQMATALQQAAPVEFDFRSHSPLYAPGEIELHASRTGDGRMELWTCSPDGPVAMTASATW